MTQHPSRCTWKKAKTVLILKRKTKFSPVVYKERRARQPTPTFLPGESQGQRSLVGYSLLLLLLLSCFSCIRLCATPQTAAHQLPHPWGSPGKNTGVDCHFLLQCMKVESKVAQSCPTLSDPMDCSPPGSSIHGIFQARVLEWGAIAFSGATVYGVIKSQTRLKRLTYTHRSVKKEERSRSIF